MASGARTFRAKSGIYLKQSQKSFSPNIGVDAWSQVLAILAYVG